MALEDQTFRELLSQPVQDYRQPWNSHEYLAVDIETTGLDPLSDHMVSIGWVPLSAARVRMYEAQQFMVRTKASVGKSATIHGLRGQDIAAGITLENALKKLFAALQNRVLIVHFSGLDKVLLDRLCFEVFGGKLEVPVVDTLTLARRQLRHQQLNACDFNLASLCTRMNLPLPTQHEALSDALATAQLFLALMTRLRGKSEPALLNVLT